MKKNEKPGPEKRGRGEKRMRVSEGEDRGGEKIEEREKCQGKGGRKEGKEELREGGKEGGGERVPEASPNTLDFLPSPPRRRPTTTRGREKKKENWEKN